MLLPANTFIFDILDLTIIQPVFSNYMWTYVWVHKRIYPIKNAKHTFPSMVLGMVKFDGGRREQDCDNQNGGDSRKYPFYSIHFTVSILQLVTEQ